ncbi:hypothetical protein [Acinetobacter dispersus]|uniref:Uncharacterized protein n=1 Tax=Acinetobacter dispersus TaxID=70348 RepID=N9L9S2_9GAMM|nr:hypothetical protein [Acinetobacter dispersus]ENW93023.1 hypothetical protein F904_02966 [Acinetobacter dispersus]
MERVSKAVERLRWDSHRIFEKVTCFDILMVLLLLFPLAIQVSINMPLKAYVQHNKAIIAEQVRAKADFFELKPLVKQDAPLKNASQEFLAFFPEKSLMNDDLFRLKGFILKNKLQLISLNYEYENLKDIPLMKVKLQVKLKGGYRAQRSLVYDLFSNFSYLAMPTYTLKNEVSEMNESDLSIYLYYSTDNNQSVGGEKNAPPNL